MGVVKKSKKSMHDRKKALDSYGQAWKIARKMAQLHGYPFDGYECRWLEDGTQGTKDQRHFHVGTTAGQGTVKWLNDWDSEIPEGSKWV